MKSERSSERRETSTPAAKKAGCAGEEGCPAKKAAAKKAAAKKAAAKKAAAKKAVRRRASEKGCGEEGMRRKRPRDIEICREEVSARRGGKAAPKKVAGNKGTKKAKN